MGTLRKSDSKAEIEVGKYLDTYFYPEYVDACFRVNDQAQQMAGIDTVVSYGATIGLKVDEKCAAHYVNRDIPTFAFEINFINQRGELSDGWLYNQHLKTDYYLLAWLWATKVKDFNYDDITSARVMFLQRSRLINYLKNHGITDSTAHEKSIQARGVNHDGVLEKKDSRHPYFYLTQHLSEKPFNVIVPRDELAKIADLHKVITGKS